ncbi:DUF427 domain-containing protein [Streptomyces sp. NPDC059861]|uniref:DUF427 domain-containing protein n=1 Tax=Streptomyces sp. NPDC059861 TaxID=3346974 RepID=UPI0036506217
MDAFYEEDDRILGHAADPQSGVTPRWYVPRADIDETWLRAADGQTFCPCKGLCDHYGIGEARRAAWTYRDAYRQVDLVSDLVSFEPDKVEVSLDGRPLRLEPGQNVVPHGIDRGMDAHEAA